MMGVMNSSGWVKLLSLDLVRTNDDGSILVVGHGANLFLGKALISMEDQKNKHNHILRRYLPMNPDGTFGN